MRGVVRSSHPPEIRESLAACWKEGVGAQVVVGILDYFLVPYALLLGASPTDIGFLIASPNLLSAAAQLVAVRAVRTAGSRHRLLMWGARAQALALLPLPALALADFPGRMAVLIGLVSVFRVVGSMMGPAWGSLVSDYLPEGERGQYFGWRSRVVSLAGIGSLALWALVLFAVKHVSRTLGFVLIFAAAVLARYVSLRHMRRMADVPAHVPPGEDVPLGLFLRRLPESNLARFIVYVAGVTFATQLAAPYFSVYMLKDLRFGDVSYTLVCLASVVAGLAAFPVWGRHADHAGTARVMKSISLWVAASPLLWIVCRTPLSLAGAEMVSGFVWSGFTLASTTFIYDAVPAHFRVRALAAFNLINGAAIFLGAALGGLLAERLPPLAGSPLRTLFLVSAVARLAAHFLLSDIFEEARESVGPVSSPRLFLSVLGLRPLVGVNTEPPAYPPLRPPRRPA